MVSAAAAHLEERRKEVNDLNVFPVADGDTGDNMALTLRSSIASTGRRSTSSAVPSWSTRSPAPP